MGLDTNKANNTEVQFLLKEYDRLSVLSVAETKQAEQRVNYFLSIATATVGSLVILFQISSVPIAIKFAITEGVLTVQLLFGIVTLNRLASRTLSLKIYGELLNEIRTYFAKRSSEITIYTQTYDDLLKSSNSRLGIKYIFFKRLRGSLTDFMMLANSLIAGGIGFVTLMISKVNMDLIISIMVAIVLFALMLFATYYEILRRIIDPFKF
jgi:hypothetical protein